MQWEGPVRVRGAVNIVKVGGDTGEEHVEDLRGLGF